MAGNRVKASLISFVTFKFLILGKHDDHGKFINAGLTNLKVLVSRVPLQLLKDSEDALQAKCQGAISINNHKLPRAKRFIASCTPTL